jgi:hypothetical protein
MKGAWILGAVLVPYIRALCTAVPKTQRMVPSFAFGKRTLMNSWSRVPLNPRTFAFAFSLPGTGIGNVLQIAAANVDVGPPVYKRDGRSSKPSSGARMMSGWKGGSSASRNEGGMKRQWGGGNAPFCVH